MDPNTSKLFPRDVYGRIALFICALFFVPMGTMGAYVFLVTARPKGVGERLMVASARSFLLAVALFFACGFIWAIATPCWMEKLLAAVARRLLLAMLVFWVPFALMALWALAMGK